MPPRWRGRVAPSRLANGNPRATTLQFTLPSIHTSHTRVYLYFLLAATV